VTRSHDRYEALAGAILLDEATPADRAELALHAESCAVCREDPAAFETPLRELVEKAAASESWRPSIEDSVIARIQERSSKRNRFAITTIGYAIGASIALNVVFVSGFGGRALDALRVTPEIAYSQVQRITLEHRPKAVPPVAAAAPAPIGPRRSVLATLAGVSRAASRRASIPQSAPPDVFAGLALGGSSGASTVAVEFAPACDAELERVAALPEPCRPLPADRHR
jgi:hypothetical protein